MPAKVDVHKLNAEATAYAERARQILNGALEGGTKEANRPASSPSTRGWLDWLLGR